MSHTSDDEPTQAYDQRAFVDGNNSSHKPSDAGETPTDELELPQPTQRMPAFSREEQDEFDKTRVMPVTREPSLQDVDTIAFPRTEAPAPAPRREPAPAPTRPAPQPAASGGYGGPSAPAYGGAGFAGIVGAGGAALPDSGRGAAGPLASRAGARLGSVLINLFAAAGLVFAAWDISRVVRFESFGVNLATQLGGGIGMIYLVTVAIFAIPAIVSALTLGMSGLGTGLFGGILLLVSIVLLLFGERIPGGFLSGEFLYTGVPYLVPVAAFMLFAGIGAHFARRSGRRQVRRASGGGV